ncbi:pyrophosphate-dependent phosphofructo-1-kinase, partial [Reticulomyxa filosa]
KWHNELKHPHEHGILIEELVDIIDSTLIKRFATKKEYGTVLMMQGLYDVLSLSERQRYFKSNKMLGRELIGHVLANELMNRWKYRALIHGKQSNSYATYDRSYNIDKLYEDIRNIVNVQCKSIGYELRASDPNAHDIISAQQLGYAAVHTWLSFREQQQQQQQQQHSAYNSNNGTLIIINGSDVLQMNLSDYLQKHLQIHDPSSYEKQTFFHEKYKIDSLGSKVACSYMIRLNKAELRDSKKLRLYSQLAACEESNFVKNFSYIAQL